MSQSYCPQPKVGDKMIIPVNFLFINGVEEVWNTGSGNDGYYYVTEDGYCIAAFEEEEGFVYSGKTVDNTFFYTALTGKPMLTEDQIDFDSNFKKVDFYAIKEKSLTQLATLNESFIDSMNETPMRVTSFPNNHVKNLLGDRSYLTIMEDLNGYYILNTEKNIRSASVEEQNFITEQMVYSVL
jgi:hypothetical protein